jgi:hypothetical protein
MGVFSMELHNSSIEWVQVFTTSTQLEADMLKANLQSADIPVQLLSQVDSSRQLTVGGLAIVKVFVPASDIDDARAIIDDIQQGNYNDI